jgi:hypothetical protein
MYASVIYGVNTQTRGWTWIIRTKKFEKIRYDVDDAALRKEKKPKPLPVCGKECHATKADAVRSLTAGE